MKITTVISDLGNVLVGFDNQRACRAIGAVLGIPPSVVHAALFAGDPYLTALYSRGDIGTREFIRRLHAAVGIPPEKGTLDRRVFEQMFCDIFEWNIEVQALYIWLRRQGFIMTALSNLEPLRWKWLEKMGVAELFDHRVLSYEERLLKPSEELMVRALDRSGCKAEDAVFIDDIALNLVPAARIGINVVHYRSFSQLVDDLLRLGLPIGT